MISQKAKSLKPSPTLAMANRARELQAQGKDVVSLTVGEPDWATFPAASEAGMQAIREGFTKYTAAHGILELRQEVAKETSQSLGVSYKADEVVIGCGAKYIIYAGLQMILDPGDEVIIHSPYWVSYPTMVELSGGVPKIVECGADTGFKITGEKLAKSITPKTKAFILCSPSNPTGLQYTKQELQELASVLEKHPNIWILSDDIYNRLVFGGGDLAPEILHVVPHFKDRVLVINGVSKTYSMTGWRVGWGLGPKELIQPMADFLSQTTSNVTSISQRAALVALQKCGEDLKQARKALEAKKIWFNSEMSKIKGLKVIPPDGAFYLWIDVHDCLGKKHKETQKLISNSKDMAECLLNSHFVATVPGVEFGSEGYLRLSFAASEENLKKAVQRFSDFSAQIFA